MSLFLLSTRTIGFKLESTPGTDETLASSDFDFKAFNISYSPEVEEYKRVYATGNFSKFASVMGKRMASVSFTVDLSMPTDTSSEPTYGKCLKACGLNQSFGSISGVFYMTSALYSNTSATIEIVEKLEGTSASQVVVKLKGCVGNVKIVFDSIGKPAKLEFEFKGAISSITDRSFSSILTPGSFDTTVPPVLMSATITAFSELLKLDKFSMDLGNQIEMEMDASEETGYKQAHVVNRNPVWSADPYLALIATNSHYARWTGGTLGSLSLTLGSTITLAAPAIQIVKAFNPGERSGAVVNNLEGIFTRGVAEDTAGGNDEFVLSFT